MSRPCGNGSSRRWVDGLAVPVPWEEWDRFDFRPAQPKALGRPRRDGGRRNMWPPPAPKQPLPSRGVGSPHRARPRPQPSARAPQVPVDVIKEVPKIVEIIRIVEVPIIKEVILGARAHPPPPRAPLGQPPPAPNR